MIQRAFYPIGPAHVTKPLERFPGRVLLDIDDDVFSVRPSFDRAGMAKRWLYGPQQSGAILERADAIVVSTEVLAATLPTTSAEVVVLPTVPDPSVVAQAHHSEKNRSICWIGTNGGLAYLDPLRGVFEDLRTSGLGTLEVVSSQRWTGPATFRHWTPDDDTSGFSRYAIGIMPLPDTPYTRAKAGFKLLQYMAAGLPVVASPVGINVELVETSGAGFLADSPTDWALRLKELLGDVELRSDLGRRGRAFVTDYADIPGHAAILSRLLVP